MVISLSDLNKSEKKYMNNESTIFINTMMFIHLTLSEKYYTNILALIGGITASRVG